MKYSYLFIVLSILSCTNPDQKSKTLEAGDWLLSFNLKGDGFLELPVQTTVDENGILTIHNSDERIKVVDVEIIGDSVYIRPAVFEGYFAGTFTKDGLIKGQYIKPSLKREVAFSLEKGTSNRFQEKESDDFQMPDLDRTWEVIFSPDSTDEKYIAKGVFHQSGKRVTGTFETTTGDYRYLEGTYKNDSLFLSTFDGAHLFLFKAVIKDHVMSGTFYSGNHWEEPFIGKANESYELPSPLELTYLKEGYDNLKFSFQDSNGNMVSLKDDRFKDKAVIVQIMGSWCPNCLDETRFYVDYLKRQKPYNVEFVALAFEYAPTKEKAFQSIDRLKSAAGIPYPVLLAQYGSVDKETANDKLPMLSQILSYPTSIYIDKKGIVRRIHTGYSGPATGIAHDKFKEDFHSFVSTLQAE
jgi:thiol-disulfide isomerase/thioredoxin